MRSRRLAGLVILLALLLVARTLWLGHRPIEAPRPATDGPSVWGWVRDERGPVAGARVRVQGMAASTVTDADGRFTLSLAPERTYHLTAWKSGYLIAGAPAGPSPRQLHLDRLPADDSEAYAWVDPRPDPQAPHNCGNCHGEIYREWAASGHARSVTNPHFRNLYDGSDWHGRPGIGWSLLAEHPDGAGVCSSCHAPGIASFNDPAFTDLRAATGVAAQGVHCDYCHKIADAGDGPLGLTHGRFGIKLLRPAAGQLFFGPLDDVDRHEDAFAPLYHESRYCASCHEGVVFGVPVYSTYSEWLESPARAEGKQCQTCHMAPTGHLTNLAPGRGGIERDPRTLANHRFFLTDQATMLRQAVQVRVAVRHDGQAVQAEVEVRADGAGHRVPTGFIDRNVLLVVEGSGADGKPAPLADGPRLPDAAGKGLAGTAGKLYARRLQDGRDPGPVPFWRAGAVVSDTRLTPGRPDQSAFVFPAATTRLRVRLLHRRFWDATAVEKGWPDNEILVLEQTIDVPAVGEASWSGP